MSDAKEAAATDATTKADKVVTVDKDPDTQKETGTVTLGSADGTAKATVYTKGQADTLLDNKANSADVYTKTAADNAAQSKVDKLANGAVKTLQNAVHNDDAHMALARSDGVEALNLANTAGKETTLRGGTGTTVQTLRDQEKGVAAGTGQSGVNYQTTMYGAGGNNNAEYTATAAQYNAFTNSGTLPTDAPAGAAGIINEGGVYKYVTNVRLGGVAAGVNANKAVNKGQLDALSDALNNISGGSLEGLNTEINDRKAADAALNQRINRNRAAIDRNSQGIANTAAIAGMAPLPNGAESGLTLGLSQYSGMQGLAIGYLHRLNESFTVKAAMATGNTGQPVSTLGLAYTWGGNSSDRITSHALQVRLHSTATELAQAKAEREQAKIKKRAHAEQSRHRPRRSHRGQRPSPSRQSRG